MREDEVLIVGAGPVGLLGALGLARSGIKVTLIECEPYIVDSPRAAVYHWSVLEGLERLGLLEQARSIGFPKQDYHYLVFKTRERISFTLEPLSAITRHPYNIHLGQNKLAELALQRLQGMPNFSVHWNTRFTGLSQDGSGVTVSAQTPAGPREFRSGWVIGADGAGSSVRRAVGLHFDGMTWPERFVATNIYYDFEQDGYARSTLMIDPQYGAIIAKLDNEGLWRCTYCEDAALAEEGVLQRMPQYFKTILSRPAEYRLAMHSPYRMHQRAAERFRAGRVMLAGDAAHVTNPTGGLGLTSGLFDIFALYEALAAVIHGEADPAVLDRYSQERRRIFLDYVSPRATENKRLIYHSSDPVRLAEDLRQLRRLETDKDFVLEVVSFTKRLESPSLVGAAGRH
ncbi:MAG TPA: FAD-dependent monooxygenase [Steroidobacteraceae bacterium]|nr:FAD-dependent monooxygenase [Steroidobacteraceae bacterium]